MADQKADGGDAEAVREPRIDYLGFAGELEKHFIEPLKDELRAAHPVGTRLVGDFFQGMIAPNSRREVSASGWLRALEAQEITRAEFLDGITVSAEHAEKALKSSTFKRLVKHKPGKATIRKDRIDELQGVDLLGAVRGLGRSIEAAARRAAA